MRFLVCLAALVLAVCSLPLETFPLELAVDSSTQAPLEETAGTDANGVEGSTVAVDINTVGPTTVDSIATTGATCQDAPTANCKAMESYCTNPLYRDVLQKNCPVTCNFCNADDCYDDSQSCASWNKNGFCKNDFYEDYWKLCRKTCGLC